MRQWSGRGDKVHRPKGGLRRKLGAEKAHIRGFDGSCPVLPGIWRPADSLSPLHPRS
ncbi:unnamed protein product [Rhizoctonia solani]|uniref:Uncharacterized protein n=1 Tax=Rhizoctonia solani TaxID=456999 RepID=A0A8H3CBP9_9AGAM|nr:unnamed protein product [Rhizoctonia solani]